MVFDAIILAGGKGERLRPFTEDRPKPMVEVGNKPIIGYQLEALAALGIKRVVIACSYLREKLQDHIGDGSKYGLEVLYSVEDKPLGRGGGIKKAMAMLNGGFEDVIVTNGDNLWKVDFTGMIARHQEKRAMVTDLVVPLKSPYGIVEVNGSDEVLGFAEKPELPYWINAGVYIFSKQIQDMLPDIGDHETETFPRLPKEKFIAFKSRLYWRAVDTVKDKTEAEKEVREVFG